MLNKKVLAVAVAAAFSQSALAAVDVDATTSQKVIYASELVTANSADITVTNAGNILDVTGEVGFSIADGTTRYVRFDLTNAEFGTTPTNADLTFTTADVGAMVTVDIGSIGADFVVYEITVSGGTVAFNDTFTLAIADYDVSTTAVSTVRYRLYEDGTDANTDTGSDLFKSAQVDFTELTAASTGLFAVEGSATATVDSGFTQFDASGTPSSTAALGYVDTDLLVGSSAFIPAGTPVTDADLIGATDGADDVQDLVFTGDMSFGTWTLHLDSATCAAASPVAITLNTDASTGGQIDDLSPATLTSGNWYLCVVVDGTEVINKGSYSATLAEAALTDGLGEINYDTTTIEVPYLTTFGDYNQRFYIVNNGSADAEYSFAFVTEAGTTATAGPAASGTVPAGEMLMVKSTDVVTLTGDTTRTSATIEVEGTEEDIMAATQTVNRLTGTTDTVTLNANSIVSPDSD